MEMQSIHTEEELQQALDASRERPVVLFKHSNACPRSARAHDEMQTMLGTAPVRSFDFAMVVVQEARPLSNAIADRFGIEHESPQAIIVHDGRAVWNASHWDVTRDRVSKALEGL